MIFVTGGTGVLGSHLLVELCRREYKIKALKRFSSSTKMIESIFDFYFGKQAKKYFDSITWLNGDILDISSLRLALDSCNTIYHCAGKVSFHKKDFNALMKVNKEGTANLVNLALELKINSFCHVSSTAAIGKQKNITSYSEENKWDSSSENSNYGVSKYSAEMEVWRGIEEGLNATIVNPCVIIGAGYWGESSLEIFKTVNQGLKFYPLGTNAFVDARDVAFCMVELVVQNKINERYLIISENLKFKTLLYLISDELNVKRPKYLAKQWMVNIAWRLEKFRSFLANSTPKITKETAKSSMSTSTYSNQKVKNTIGHNFIPIKDAVTNAVNFHKQMKRIKN